ncbi:DUF3231 family protein [Bacillus sp. PS06]|uniref:DUF3231 family protein n=1 Tax=Bacillus sp. PS06 TaxID=2764176 RepID=UPI00296F7EB2|nr:DUF3231 family protein [Bacillus sp. PS06]
MKTKEEKSHSLTSAEMSALWLQYMGDSMAVCVNKYFLNIVEDTTVKSIVKDALIQSQNHINQITSIFNSANCQIPKGFTDEDVNLHAPRLFSDPFIHFYSYIMTVHGLTAYSLALTTLERADLQDYFFECITSAKDLLQKIVKSASTQTYFSSIPSIPAPSKVEFTQSTGMISNLFGEKRPLNSSEISTLFFNSKKTGCISSLSLAFSQVATNEDVRHFMVRNMKLAGKDAASFDTILKEDHLPIPEKWDAEITDSTVSPFSDKLMMFHAALLINAALSYYGASIGASLRSDIMLNYSKVMTHLMKAGAICYNILVKHEWLEKQPEAINRTSLSQKTEN